MKRLFLSFTLLLFSFIVSSQTAGTLDSTFGVYGKVMTNVSPLSTSDNLEDLLLQPDGKLIAVGWFHTSTGMANYSDLAMIRYNTDGFKDSTFGTNGKVIYNLAQAGWNGDFIRSAVLQNDGKILCTGSTQAATSSQIVLTRFLSNGVMDSTFGSNGISELDLTASTDEGMSVIVQTDGKILVGAVSNPSVVIRYLSNGIIDSTFGSNGLSYLSVTVRDLSLVSDGKIIVAGECNPIATPGWAYFGVTRLDSTGVVDTTFGTNGLTYFDQSNVAGPTFYSSWVNDIDVQPDGKIIVAGGCTNNTGGTDTRFAAGRLNPDGLLDSTFGSLGRIVIDFFPGNFDRIHEMVIQPDGKIFFVGQTEVAPLIIPTDFAIARINSDGTLDNTFNSTGKLQIDFTGSHDYGYACVLQPDGKLVVDGSAINSSGNYDFSLVRLLNDLNLGVVDLHNNFETTLFYPNPIEQSSTLEFSLLSNETISINLMDIQGRQIKTFVNNKKMVEGKHQEILEFPAELAKGVYFISLSSDEGVINIKIVK